VAPNAPDHPTLPSAAPIRFLSKEWIAALGELVPGTSPGRSGEAGGSLSLGQIVEGAPGGDVMYTIRLGDGAGDAPRVVEGSVSEADVVLVESYETACGLASGTLSPSEAIRSDRVKVRGAARLLAANQDLLVQLAHALDDLRALTTF
jgi:hypothetical protein